MTTLSRKMLGYALGRTVLASDRPLLAEMAAAGGNAAFSDLARQESSPAVNSVTARATTRTGAQARQQSAGVR